MARRVALALSCCLALSAITAAQQPPLLDPWLKRDLGKIPHQKVVPNVERYHANAIVVAPDGKSLAYEGVWGTCLLSFPEGKLLHKLEEPFKEHAPVLAFSSDGRQLIGAGNGFRVWDVGTGKLVVSETWSWEHVFKGWADEPYCNPAVSPDSTRVYAAARDDSIMVVDAKTGKVLQRILNFINKPRHIAVAPDGKRVAVSTRSGVRVVDPQKPTEFVRIDSDPGDPDSMWCEAGFSPDGKQLYVVGQNGRFNQHQFRVWDFAKEELVICVQDQFTPRNVFHTLGDGHYVAVLHPGWTRVRVYDLKAKRPLGYLWGEDGLLFPFARTPDGKHLIGVGRKDGFKTMKTEDVLALITKAEPEKK